ncbi:MAG: hypothetical protein MK052_10205 [Alphaproteobacteria bacterium]|nr:hypothetical protein [Alphaproteobacteria bacterium]
MPLNIVSSSSTTPDDLMVATLNPAEAPKDPAFVSLPRSQAARETPNAAGVRDPLKMVALDLDDVSPKPHTTNERGADPFDNKAAEGKGTEERKFIGYEFQGMVMVGKDRTPAFHDKLIDVDGTPTLNIHLATETPEFFQDGAIQTMLKNRDNAFPEALFSADDKDATSGINSVLQPLSSNEVVEKQLRVLAKEFEEDLGIKVNITTNGQPPEKSITIMGFESADDRLIAFSTLPPTMKDHLATKPYAQDDGLVMVNTDYLQKSASDSQQASEQPDAKEKKSFEMSDKRTHDVLAKEVLRSIGIAQPDDIAKFQDPNLTKYVAAELSVMSVSDDLEHFKFGEKKSDGNTEGLGALEYGLAKWVNPEHNQTASPETAEPQIFNLGEQHAITIENNASSYTHNNDKPVSGRKNQLPATPIIAGSGDTMVGSDGNDFFDTSPGYCSRITDAENGNQLFPVIKGHIKKIETGKGDNSVVLSMAGDQEIETGEGSNRILALDHTMSGEKTITSTSAGDSLVITSNLLKSMKTPAIQQDGEDLTIADEEKDFNASIRLHNQTQPNAGISNIVVVDGRGEEKFNSNAVDNAQLSTKEGLEAIMQQAKEVADQQPWFERTRERFEPAPPGKNWTDRVTETDAEIRR